MPGVNTLRDLGASPEAAGPDRAVTSVIPGADAGHAGLRAPEPPPEIAPPGPGHRVMLGLVARRYYLDGRSKVEIAKESGLSRFKVARMLEEARERGIVRIEVAEDPSVDLEVSVRLREALGIEHAIVVPSGGEVRDLRARVGVVAARLLLELLDPADVLGLPWSRSVHAMVEHLPELPPVEVVQLCGVAAGSGADASAVDVVVRAARRAGTPGHVFFSPLLVADPDTAAALRREPQVGDALGRAGQVTTAVVGVGGWAPALSTVYDACDEVTRDQASAAGVVGEIAGACFDAAGALVYTPVAGRLVAVDGATLAAIPRVLALATGAERAAAVRAAAAGGLITSLVTDTDLAAAVLAG